MDNKKIAVYTVITGGYDKLQDIELIDVNCDYYVVSNENIKVFEPWKLIKPKNKSSSEMSNKDFNRYYKINPHLIFPDYALSIYLDGNIKIKNKLSDWATKQSLISYFSIYSHPERKDIYSEAKVCSFIGTDFFWTIRGQINRYISEGYDSHGLYEANILLRKHNDLAVVHLMETWWCEYFNKKNAKRDQLSLPYVLWRTGFKVNNMGISDARYEHRYFEYITHRKNRHDKLETKIKKIVNRTIGREVL